MDAAGDPADRIRALPDHLLHLILGFLGDAIAAAARTAVLSRRWPHLWFHAASLVLSDDNLPTVSHVGCHAKPGCCFAGFVDRLFARRGDASIGSLQIRLLSDHHRCTSPEKLNAWICYAARHAVDSFLIRVTENYSTTTTIELPSHGRTASIQLNLSGNRLRLPAAAAMYHALAELELNSARLGSGGRALGDFVSSCCPRLRKLVIRSPMGLPPELVIRGGALEELRLLHAEDLRTLDVAAPNLRVFQVDHRSHAAPRHDKFANRRLVRVVAPRLEVISMRESLVGKHPDLDIHGLSSVRRLKDLHLDMHINTGTGIWLLRNCPRVEHVEVFLKHGFFTPTTAQQGLVAALTAGGLMDLAAEGVVPFASVRSLKLDTTSLPQNCLVASISSLLLRCSRLTSLSIVSSKRPGINFECTCGDRESHRRISLGSLEVVEISDFRGATEEMDLVSLLFESTNSIKRMTLTKPAKIFGARSAWSPINAATSWAVMMGEVDPLLDEKLKGITCSTGRGRWHIKEDVYTWTSTSQQSSSLNAASPSKNETRRLFCT